MHIIPATSYTFDDTKGIKKEEGPPPASVTGSTAPPSGPRQIGPITMLRKAQGFCFRCDFNETNTNLEELDPYLRKAIVNMAIYSSRPTVQLANLAENLVKLYNMDARQYIEGEPEWTVDSALTCITCGHGTANAFHIKNYTLQSTGFILHTLDKALFTEYEDGHIECIDTALKYREKFGKQILGLKSTR